MIGSATDWNGRPWQETVLYEVHVGTFTPEGTYRAIIDKLDHLVDTGITALELMPLADFPGRWNWGYDGVLPFAPDSVYGRPEDLKALIDAAHVRGLMVFLDVVYNHFGPEGNYLAPHRPAVLLRTRRRRGAARSTTRSRKCAPSRSRMRCIGCATIASTGCGSMPFMPSPTPGTPEILPQISAPRPAALAGRNRPPHPSRAGKRRQPRRVARCRQEDPPAGHYRAQWNDDYHHAWHVLLTRREPGLLSRL